MGNLHEKKKNLRNVKFPILFFKFYSFLDFIFTVDDLIGVFFAYLKLFVNAVFNGKCYNTLLVGFYFESLFVELQGNLLVFKVLAVDLFEGHFYFHGFCRLFGIDVFS